MLTLLLTIATSLAEAPHTGIPVQGIEGLSAPIFQTADTGWWAQIPRGTAQVYVAPSSTEAAAWVGNMKEKMDKYKPSANQLFIDETSVNEAFGDGIGLLIARDANIALMVRHDGQAREWAKSIHSTIIDIPIPPLEPATLEKHGEEWLVESPEGTVHLMFRGGVTTKTPQLRFSTPPDYVVIWDGWGRSVRSIFGTEHQGEAEVPVP